MIIQLRETDGLTIGLDWQGIAGRALVDSGGYGTIGTFIKNVTTAGTRVQLSATSVPCRKVVINARIGSADAVTVGDANVVGAAATQRGICLMPGNDPITIEVSDLNLLWIDSISNGDGVCGAYFL